IPNVEGRSGTVATFQGYRRFGLKFLCLCAFALTTSLLSGCQYYSDYAEDVLEPGPPVYMLDTGDQIRLYIFDQEALSRNYAIDDRGNISIPLVGNIRARGRTTTELERAVAAELRRAKLIADANVSVEVIGYRPFYVYGEIRGAGRYVYQPGMNIEMALATAGGITERGDPRSVQVTRVVRGQRLVQNVGMNFRIQP